MGSPYVFAYEGEFRFDAAPEVLWEKLTQTDRFGEWWPWMRNLEVSGTPIEAGSEFRFRVVSLLPWAMRLTVEVDRAERPDCVDVSVGGHLAGPATLSFREQDGVTVARLTWNVEVMERGMRAGARVARPLLKWGQDWAVRIALRNFRRHLARERSADEGPG